MGRSERDAATEEEEVVDCDLAVLGVGVGAAVAASKVEAAFGTGAIDVSLGLSSDSFRLKLQLININIEVRHTELIGNLKLGNVLVFAHLIFWPLLAYEAMNKLNKNPNITYLETSNQL